MKTTKAIKAWAVVRKNKIERNFWTESMLIYSKKWQAEEESEATERVLPVLITPITKKKV